MEAPSQIFKKTENSGRSPPNGHWISQGTQKCAEAAENSLTNYPKTGGAEAKAS
jgi:hypothetical protein